MLVKNLKGFLFIGFIYFCAIFVSSFANKFSNIIVPTSILCLLFGIIIFNSFSITSKVLPGRDYIKKNFLQWAIILLGLKISLTKLFSVSSQAALIIFSAFVIIAIVAFILSRFWHDQKELVGLLAIGTGICGVTAVMVSSSILKSKDHNVGYAVMVITLCGSLALFIYPFLVELIFMTDLAKGIFLGIGIHDTSQVIAAAMVHFDIHQNERVLEIATITKLFRNLFLIILIPMLVIWMNKRQQLTKNLPFIELIKKTVPIFLVGFITMIIIRTVGDLYFINNSLWNDLINFINHLVSILFGLALISLGSSINIKLIVQQGVKPIFIGFTFSIFVMLTIWMSINLLGLNY